MHAHDRGDRITGSEMKRNEFLRIAKGNRKAALLMINERLRFSAFYILLPDIAAAGLLDGLSPRNRAAALLCANSDPEKSPAGLAGQKLPVCDETHAALKWALTSGYRENGLGEAYDQALDTAVSLLIRVYHDRDALSPAVRLLFRRHRSGRYIHDLVWALFGARDPGFLRLAAEYLRSSDRRDVALAQALLRHAADSDASPAGARGHAACSAWLKENSPYLTFTNESFHQSSEPVLYRVNLEAKYLCADNAAQPAEVPDTETAARLEAFRALPGEQQALLAHYSRRLAMRDRQRWSRFMRYPVDRQTEIAGGGAGGAR